MVVGKENRFYDLAEAGSEGNRSEFVGARLRTGQKQAGGPDLRHMTLVNAKVIQLENGVARCL